MITVSGRLPECGNVSGQNKGVQANLYGLITDNDNIEKSEPIFSGKQQD